ncbi:MAG: DUF1016 domain-containing protein [Phycisphaerae bacterium]|nr:DUF1016 domain-containing protein [Saprospiraceae bacterium]
MKQPSSIPPEYRPWLENLKSRIRSAQIKAALSVNEHLIRLYWELGQMIAERQENAQWGTAVVEQIALDLKEEFPHLTGFSRSNLFYMRQFYQFYRNADEFVQQLAGQIPWWHNILIFTKSDSLETAQFYLSATLQNNWSRNVLGIQIESRLHERQGQAITNFAQTLPQPQADLAQQTLKDPYLFDFLAMTPAMHEHAGKMNFYLSAEDDLLRTETDNPSIGIILCKSKNRVEVEYALRDLNKPIGVSQWILTQNLPAEIQSAFPTIEQIEQELSEPLIKPGS